MSSRPAKLNPKWIERRISGVSAQITSGDGGGNPPKSNPEAKNMHGTQVARWKRLLDHYQLMLDMRTAIRARRVAKLGKPKTVVEVVEVVGAPPEPVVISIPPVGVYPADPPEVVHAGE